MNFAYSGEMLGRDGKCFSLAYDIYKGRVTFLVTMEHKAFSEHMYKDF